MLHRPIVGKPPEDIMRRTPFIPLLALLAICACKPGGITVSGAVSYRERIALPPDAIVRVAIEDVTLAGAPATLVATSELRPAGRQVPIPYSITLMDPATIDPKHLYGLRVRIEDGAGSLLFVNDTHLGVITNGVFKQDVVVKRVAAP